MEHFEGLTGFPLSLFYCLRSGINSVKIGTVPELKKGMAAPMTSSDRTKDELRKQLREAALEYHEFPAPGKISVTPIKPLANQRDLSLAYSPGVAAACEEIAADPQSVFKYTARGNLVAVISNGTAVLGLGNIGPLAAKPVMEGKEIGRAHV